MEQDNLYFEQKPTERQKIGGLQSMMFLNILMVFLIALVIFAIYMLSKDIILYGRIYLDKSNDCIHMTEKGTFWKKFIKINEYRALQLGYEPKRLHFGSATVGGVTTGGFYTTGGHNVIESSTKTGRYQFMFADSGRRNNGYTIPISRIRLTEELYKEAENSSIAKYLNPETQTIELNTRIHLSEAEKISLLNKADRLARGVPLTSGMSLNYSEGLPSYEKCVEILNWMCGK